MSASDHRDRSADILAHLRRRERWRWWEAAFWLALLAAILVFPSHAALVNEALVYGLFALSIDLILGLAGIVTLGQAAFFGLGAYAAGILANAGYDDPLLGLAAAVVPAAGVGLVTAPLLLRGADLTRLMVTMGVALMLGELANKFDGLTGGADGLNFTVAPLFGRFSLGAMGEGPRNAALFSFAVLFALFVLARRIKSSPFGLSLAGLRENRLRAGALGVATSWRIVAIYAVAAAYAGVAGALIAETTQIASLDLFAFHRSADTLLMLIIGGVGWLYGGLIGAGVFIVIRDVVSAATPEYWEFWIGLMLVALVLTGRDRLAALIGLRK
jgi:branched-chain amino acid transport system permease protein